MTEAARWFAAAAQQGSPEALVALGQCLLQGRGLPLDRDKARDCFSRAAKLGSTDAAELLKTHFGQP